MKVWGRNCLLWYLILLLYFVLWCRPLMAADDEEKLLIKGNLRYRHEVINQEDKSNRIRQRFRARIGLTGIVNEEMKISIQLASGSDDPVSTNQTLGAGFSSKPVVIDLAYFDYTPHFASGLRVVGGKIINPFIKPKKSELIWDSDFNPEGMALFFSIKRQGWEFDLGTAGLWVQERKEDEDSILYAGQTALRFFGGENIQIMFGGGYYYYTSTKGYAPFYDKSDSMGNHLDAERNYANDFELIEAMAEFSFSVHDRPLTLMGDYVSNIAAKKTSAKEKENQGWLGGIAYGKAKKPFSWELRYTYRNLEANAVVGIFTDSDFVGGGTDGKGHEMNLKLAIMKNVSLGASYFINQAGLSSEIQKEYRRLQLDLMMKF